MSLLTLSLGIGSTMLPAAAQSEGSTLSAANDCLGAALDQQQRRDFDRAAGDAAAEARTHIVGVPRRPLLMLPSCLSPAGRPWAAAHQAATLSHTTPPALLLQYIEVETAVKTASKRRREHQAAQVCGWCAAGEAPVPAQPACRPPLARVC